MYFEHLKEDEEFKKYVEEHPELLGL